eukprot:1676957-Rhodomonas_salina.1
MERKRRHPDAVSRHDTSSHGTEVRFRHSNVLRSRLLTAAGLLYSMFVTLVDCSIPTFDDSAASSRIFCHGSMDLIGPGPALLSHERDWRAGGKREKGARGEGGRERMSASSSAQSAVVSFPFSRLRLRGGGDGEEKESESEATGEAESEMVDPYDPAVYGRSQDGREEGFGGEEEEGEDGIYGLEGGREGEGGGMDYEG